MLDTASYGIEATATGISIRVYVAPRSSFNKVVGLHNGAIKIALTAPPVDGAANKALVGFVAKVLEVPRGAVHIIAGEASRHKIVSVAGVGAQTALKKLALSD